MERRGLVVEHDVIRPGNAHDVSDTRHRQEREQHVHVILVGLGVVGVADVTAHRQAEELATEVVLKAGADDLLAVIEILGADEADDRVHQERLELARHGIGPRFAGLLIDTLVGVRRKGAALAGLEIHHVVAHRPTLERQRGTAPLLDDTQVDAEAGVGRLRSGDRLKHQIQRRATVDGLDAGGNVGQHTGLGGDLVLGDDGVQHMNERRCRRDAVGGGINADHRVTTAVHESINHTGGDPGRIVSRVVGLETCG